MRRLILLALIALAGVALALPRPGSTPVRGVGTLHGVAQLLRCDAGALRQVAENPGDAASAGCAGLARGLAGGGRP